MPVPTPSSTDPAPSPVRPGLDDGALDDLAVFETLAWQRRSNLRVDPDTPVPDALVARLCRLAAWAPNHHHTAPWRFCAVTDEGRAVLGEALAADLADAGETAEAKLVKARTKYGRAPLVLVVASAAGADDVVTVENRDAVAAAVENLLLGATAAGLATLWSSGAATRSPRVASVCGFDPDDQVVGLVYVGWPTAEANAPAQRPEPTIGVLTGRSEG